MRLLPVSAMYKLSDLSRATPYGWLSHVALASTLSAEYPAYVALYGVVEHLHVVQTGFVPHLDAPATVVIVADVNKRTTRTRLLPVSAMYRFPDESTARLLGLFSEADSAEPPSPAYAAVPVPATVTNTPVFQTTLRT
jgi:hypothetical protein